MATQDDLDALYACLLSEFLDRRKALAAALRKAGDKDLAAKVASAAKPTPAAWAVNQLAHRYPGEMAALMETGAALRVELRASFAGRSDASVKAMASAQAEQRTTVTALVPLARALLEAGGASASAAVLERVATTLTTISTTGTWGDSAPLRLTKELNPPGIEALAALVADVVPAPARVTAPPPAPAPLATIREPAPREGSDHPPSQRQVAPSKDAPEQDALKKEDAARRAAAEAAEQLAAAEAALQAAATAEQQAKAALQGAQAAVAELRQTREARQAHAREAGRLAAELQQAADEARKKAQTAAAAAQKADAEVEDAIRAERAGRDELAVAEHAVTRTATERAVAEATVRRMGASSPSGKA